MERGTLLLYLRDIRDLEFAKNRIISIYDYEKRQFERKEKELQDIEFWKADKMEGGWTTKKKGLIIFGGVLVLLIIGCLLNTETNSFEQGVFTLGIILSVIFLIILPIYLAQKEIKEYQIFVKDIEYHNEKESIRAESNTRIYNELKANWDKRSTYLLNEKKKVISLLKEYYSINILANQYRNLQSVYYIYDYMSSSQETLKDTLMHEHMENGIQRILERLDYIIKQNETIIFQNRIAESTNEKLLNQNTRMLESLKRNESNMELVAQYSQLSANYSKANAYFSLANYLK